MGSGSKKLGRLRLAMGPRGTIKRFERHSGIETVGGVQGIVRIVLVCRIERVVGAITIRRIDRIPRVIAVSWVEGIAGIVSLRWIQRIIRTVLIDWIEDVVVALVFFIETGFRKSISA